MPKAYSPTYLLTVDGIPVQVTRKAVRNVNIRIREDGSVHMSVPWRVSRQQAEGIARERLDWISEKRGRLLSRPSAAPHLWRTGETLDVWGEPHRIEVVEGYPERAWLDDGVLHLAVAPGHSGDGDAAVATRASMVESLLAREEKAALAEMLPRVEARVGRRPASVTLRRMRTRWGSCTTSKGTIRINLALAEHPRACLEMVLTHEICHLIEPNHGPRFKALMDRCYPGWREVQRHLDENPPRMV